MLIEIEKERKELLQDIENDIEKNRLHMNKRREEYNKKN
jgi:hypothetical protein